MINVTLFENNSEEADEENHDICIQIPFLSPLQYSIAV